jgi:hypothetical protein
MMENLAKALIRFHMEVGKVKKDSKNPYFNSSYASLSNILDIVTPPLIVSGLTIVQMPVGDGLLKTILMHESGEFLESEFDMKIVKRDPQSLGSAITYARRYAIGAILCLNIDDDDDANGAMPPKQAPKLPVEALSTDKPWFGATNKDGALTPEAIKLCNAFISGKRTWEQFYEKYRISKKNKEAMIAYIEAKIINAVQHDASEVDITP